MPVEFVVVGVVGIVSVLVLVFVFWCALIFQLAGTVKLVAIEFFKLVGWLRRSIAA